MWDFSLFKIFGLLLRTTPFLVLRLLVYMTITVAYVISLGAGTGIGWLIAQAGGAFWGGAIGFGIVTGVLYWAREYLLYLVKAGHIAVLVELMQGKPIPGGRNQISYASGVVKQHFVESSVLFGVDRLISGILRAFNRVMLRVANFLPIPGLDGVARFAGAVVTMSLTYVDEMILAYNLRNHIENPWAGARDGLVLYAQNFGNLLKNALWLTVLTWALAILIFALILVPVGALVAMAPSMAGFWTFAVAAIIAWGLKAALVDPLAMAALMQCYFKAIEGQTPQAEWVGKLESASGKFTKLAQQAQSYVAPAPATAPTVAQG